MCKAKPIITEKQECDARGEDYTWIQDQNSPTDENAGECKFREQDPPPNYDEKQLCESQGYVWDGTQPVGLRCTVPENTPPPDDCHNTNTCPPPKDTDTDGIPDNLDKCPTAKATTDKDGDGCEDVTDDGKIIPTDDPSGTPGISGIAECKDLPFLKCVEAIAEELLNEKEETKETTFLGEYGFDTTTWYLVGGIIVIGIIVALINKPRVVYRSY